MIFTTTDSAYKSRNGSKVKVLRPLTRKEADIDDVGMMYKIEFSDGFVIDAFEDELEEAHD